MVQNKIDLAQDSNGPAANDQAGDQRKSERTRTVMRVVKVKSSADEGLARLQNISDGGMKLRLTLPLHLGDTLNVHLADTKTVAATVIWTEGEYCGVRFDEAIDSGSLLVEMAEQTRNGTMRPVRLPTNVSGVAYAEGNIQPIRVRDVSQRGMKIEHRSGFDEGVSVKIVLASGVERRGVVRWSRDGMAGIQFLEPISVEELGSSKCL